MLTRYTVCLAEFPELLEWLEGKMTIEDLNERVFNEGFLPIEWQRQYSPNFGFYWVFHGYATTSFEEINSERFASECYLKGWKLFLKKN